MFVSNDTLTHESIDKVKPETSTNVTCDTRTLGADLEAEIMRFAGLKALSADRLSGHWPASGEQGV